MKMAAKKCDDLLMLACGGSLLLLLLLVSPAKARANQNDRLPPISQQSTDPLLTHHHAFPVCIDDSDCGKLGQGNKYACFQYLCYPWKDDSDIDPEDRIDTCRKDEDCPDNQFCYRHYDKRHVNRGLCFERTSECYEDEEDCPEGQGCCAGICCQEKYYRQFRVLPCISHHGCQDLGLGNYCCPRANETSVCCNTDPNPPPVTTTTPLPRQAAVGGTAPSSSHLAPPLGAGAAGILLHLMMIKTAACLQRTF